jgi:hypothetical protein
MTTEFDAEAMVDFMAPVMGITIATEWRASVIENLRATEALASYVQAFPLEDHVEPAPNFEP